VDVTGGCWSGMCARDAERAASCLWLTGNFGCRMWTLVDDGATSDSPLLEALNCRRCSIQH